MSASTIHPELSNEHPEIRVVCEAADAASVITLTHFRQALAVDNKAGPNDFDPVTVADRLAEQAIRKVLTSQYPDYGFLGEETDALTRAGQPCWVVDPIDGTRAFITGLPLWGTLIGLNTNSAPHLGLLDVPALGERFLATGNRAVMHSNGEWTALSTSRCTHIDSAILQTTTPDMFRHAEELSAFQSLGQRVRMTRYGGDCYCYALLAMGFVDVVMEADLQPYDIQALVPLVTGAGGVISDWSGGSAMNGGRIVASATAELHNEVLAHTAQFAV